ncbi:zinc finger BED domain-containing 1-like, partial [Brachionus plicatilis]
MAHNDSSTYSSDTESKSDERYSSTDLSDNDSDFGTVNLQNTQTESGYGCSSVRSQTEAQSSNFTSLNSNQESSTGAKCESNKKVKPDIDEKLVEWIIDDLQPLSVVEGQKFIDLLNILDSSYQVPCLSKIEYLIDNFYEKSLKDKKDILQKIK